MTDDPSLMRIGRATACCTAPHQAVRGTTMLIGPVHQEELVQPAGASEI